MKRYALLVTAMVIALLGAFGVVEAWGVPLLADPQPWLQRGGPFAAAVGVGLLVGDVLLPVPSSLVMVAHGALFGVAIGSALSLAGSLGAALVAFAIGRRGGPLITRVVGADEQARADALLARWGALAVLVTRPVPVLAETMAVLAGAGRVDAGRFTLAAALGSVPAAVLYALAGAVAASFANVILVFAGVLLLAAAFWLAARWHGSHAPAESTAPP